MCACLHFFHLHSFVTCFCGQASVRSLQLPPVRPSSPPLIPVLLLHCLPCSIIPHKMPLSFLFFHPTPSPPTVHFHSYSSCLLACGASSIRIHRTPSHPTPSSSVLSPVAGWMPSPFSLQLVNPRPSGPSSPRRRTTAKKREGYLSQRILYMTYYTSRVSCSPATTPPYSVQAPIWPTFLLSLVLVLVLVLDHHRTARCAHNKRAPARRAPPPCGVVPAVA